MVHSKVTVFSSKSIVSVTDIDKSLQWIRWFLKLIGAWPKSKKPSKLEKILRDMQIFICSFMIVVMMIPFGLSTFLDEDATVRLRSLGPLSFWVMASLKYFLLFFHGDNIQRCIEHIETDWKRISLDEDREIMLDSVKFAGYIVGFCAFFMHMSVLLYNIVRGLSSVLAIVGNETINVHLVPLPFYNGLIDARFSPVFEVVFVLQCFSTVTVNSITVAVCTVGTVFVMHAYGQLGILMVWLKKFVKEGKKCCGVQNGLAVLVEHHLRVLSFISYVEEIMHQICLVEIVGCTMNICLLGYYFITEWERNNMKTSIALSIIFTSISFNIFIFCYIGEILSEQCKLVGETAYMTDWYRLPKETALCFILIISRSSLLIRITAGKLIQLSIATFGDVIRTSMAYLNMLRAVSL